jgi:glyoxylase-like metal-dependent hydrolase (beta-lactamase superfamily II)
MRIAAAATVAAAAVLLSSLPGRAQTDFDKVQIKVQKVAGSVYVLYGAGGNIAVSVGDDGVVMVDDQFAPLAPKVKKAIASITKKPVRFLLNTHWHGDHTGGNGAFAQGGVTILAHENVRKRLAAGNPAPGFTHADPAPAQALPVITFDQSATVHLNGEDIRAVHVPRGHTDGDSIVYFTKSNVVHLGDDFFAVGFPFVDLGSGGSVKGTIEALEKLIPTLPADAKLIPGHGEVAGVEALKTYVRNLSDIYAAVQAGVGQRKSLEELKKERVLSKWSSMSWSFLNEDGFLEMVYADITQSQPSTAR